MDKTIFWIISIIGYVLAVVCLLTAIILFFKLHILYVIKDLNGTIAQEEIRVLREKAKTGRNERVKFYDPNTELTEKLEKEIKEIRVDANEIQTDDSTGILQSQKIINKNFILVTNIVYVHTNEAI